VSKNGVTLKIRFGVVQGYLKMAPFDRPYANFYFIVNIALSTLKNIVP